jgi:hypothetical protein
MHLRLRDGDHPAGDGCLEGRFELAEGDFPLHDSAQVVLIEVEEERRLRARSLLAGGGRCGKAHHRPGH